MKTKLLKQLRREANMNLDFTGGWSGHWVTKIKDVTYISETVSGAQYVFGHFNKFLTRAILHRVKFMRLKRLPNDIEYNNVFYFGKVIMINTKK